MVVRSGSQVMTSFAPVQSDDVATLISILFVQLYFLCWHMLALLVVDLWDFGLVKRFLRIKLQV